MFASFILPLGLAALAALVVLIVVRPLRRAIVTRPIFSTYRKVLPQMSDTERDALEAGTVWWEGELFRGAPDWQKLHAYPVPKLTPEEQSFLDKECAEACRLVDDWKVTHELYDLPNEAWRYIKDKGFLGMIIPKKYGGLEFSAYAHSQVVTKLSTRSSALSVSVIGGPLTFERAKTKSSNAPKAIRIQKYGAIAKSRLCGQTMMAPPTARPTATA